MNNIYTILKGQDYYPQELVANFISIKDLKQFLINIEFDKYECYDYNIIVYSLKSKKITHSKFYYFVDFKIIVEKLKNSNRR